MVNHVKVYLHICMTSASDIMIGIIYDILALSKRSGGGDQIAAITLESLRQLDDVLIIPTFDRLFNEERKEICQELNKLENTYIIPNTIKNFCKNDTINNINALVTDLARELRSLHPKLLFDPYPYVYLKKPPLKISEYLEGFKLLIRNELCSNELLFFPAWCLSKKSGIPLVILWQHGTRSWRCIPRILAKMIMLGMPESYLIPLFRRITDMMVDSFRRDFVRLILSVGEGPINLLGLSKWKKVKILNPGVVIDMPGEIGKSRNDKEDYFIYLSRMEPAKGLFDIIYIMRALRKVGISPNFVLVGRFKKLEIEKKFRKIAEKAGVLDKITLTGFVTNEVKFDLLSKAKAMVFPTHVDNFPLVILESLAVGTPVVTYNIPGPRDAYRGIDGVHFVKEFDFEAVANTIKKIIKDPNSESHYYSEKTKEFLRAHTNKELFRQNFQKYILEIL